MFSTNPLYLFIFRRFDQHHTHYQGTACRLKFKFLLILQYSWNRDKTIKYYNQIILLYKETIKKLTIVKKKQFSRTNDFIWIRSISFDKQTFFVFLNVKGDIPICSPDLSFKCLSVSL